MGNSICASRVAHLSCAASVVVIDLVLFRLIGGDAFISSFDLLIFRHGAGVSKFAVEVEGISPVPTFSCSSGCSSSIRVPPHSGEYSMVTTSVFYFIIVALTSSVSTVAASNAALVSTSAFSHVLIFILSIGFSCTSSPNCSACSPD